MPSRVPCEGSVFLDYFPAVECGQTNLQLSTSACAQRVGNRQETSDRFRGGGLCEELRRRFGAVGKNDAGVSDLAESASRPRWRVIMAPALLAEFLLQRRLQAAEALANEYLQRAEPRGVSRVCSIRALGRKLEIDPLRQEVAALKVAEQTALQFDLGRIWCRLCRHGRHLRANDGTHISRIIKERF